MSTTIEIENFRGIAKGRIDDLMPLSVLVGRNNSGKSTVLEALYLASNKDHRLVAEVARRRGWCGLDCVSQLAFGGQNSSRSESDASFSISWGSCRVSISDIHIWVTAQGVSKEVVINDDGSSYLVDDNYIYGDQECILIDPDTVTAAGMLEDAYSAALDKGRESEIDDLVKAIDPTGPTLRILKKGDRYVLHTVTSVRAVSVYFGGDGFKRLLFVAFNLAAFAGKQVLLEEPECFQHPSYLGRLASLIWAAIGQGTQVILSTHSLELLNHIFLAEDAPLASSAIFHTSLEAGELTAVRISGENAAERLDELGEDLRQ
jgi:hypothetical protein